METVEKHDEYRIEPKEAPGCAIGAVSEVCQQMRYMFYTRARQHAYDGACLCVKLHQVHSSYEGGRFVKTAPTCCFRSLHLGPESFFLNPFPTTISS